MPRLCVLVALFCLSCGQAEPGRLPSETARPVADSAYEPRYAERFRLEPAGGAWILTIWPPWHDPAVPGSGLRYTLLPEGSGPSADDGRTVQLPVRRLVTTSTTEVAHLEVLDMAEVLVGHSELDHPSSPSVRRQIESGSVAEMGGGSRLHPELLLEAAPDAVLADFMARSELERLAHVEAAGVPIVIMPTFLEASPLGRAEWVVVTGVLLGRFDEAKAAFEEVETAYRALAERVAADLEREPDRVAPTVFTGGPWNDVWYVPGGRSYTAQFLADAGARYLWADEGSTGALPLDIEAVYEKSLDAEVWLYPSSWSSLQQIVAADPRLGDFRAAREGKVYSNDRRTNGLGGNDFWESGAARPDRVLADLIRIFRPELLPAHELIYHRQLEPE
ncbi:MAG: ABC transporter substrate-binding protein [Thermoanaerobaculia bacterium]|nr:ABC transporter substrate-binding protein [Thermoanaerobaculia bacterium]